MPSATATALRVARLGLLLSIAIYAIGLLLLATGLAGQWLYSLGLFAAGWIALSAAACLILQFVQLLQWRRGARRRQNEAAAAQRRA